MKVHLTTLPDSLTTPSDRNRTYAVAPNAHGTLSVLETVRRGNDVSVLNVQNIPREAVHMARTFPDGATVLVCRGNANLVAKLKRHTATRVKQVERPQFGPKMRRLSDGSSARAVNGKPVVEPELRVTRGMMRSISNEPAMMSALRLVAADDPLDFRTESVVFV